MSRNPVSNPLISSRSRARFSSSLAIAVSLLLVSFLLAPVAALAMPDPEACHGIFFSTEEPFLSRSATPADGDSLISDGDLLAVSRLGQTGGLCARNRDLLAAFGVDVDLGLDAVDVLDAERFQVAFSTESGAPGGAFTGGDLLFTSGASVPNRALLYLFDLYPADDLGLDAVHLVGEPEGLERLADELGAAGLGYWQAEPQELSSLLQYLGVDVLFSTELDAPGAGGPAFRAGDLLSAASGTVVASNDELVLAAEPGQDAFSTSAAAGLDAVTASRGGAAKTLYLSTESSRRAVPAFGDGDLLRRGRGVDVSHAVLMAPFGADPEVVGLDAFHGPVDAEVAPLTVVIDPAVEPIQPSLPALDGVGERPLEAIADPDGRVVSFVAEEVVLQTDDTSELASFLAATGGHVIAEIPAFLEVPKTYLVRVDQAAGDLGRLTADLEALDGGERGRASGDHRVSSQRGALTLALAARAAVDGHRVGINWFDGDDSPPTSTAEAPGGPSGYTPDAYQWPYMSRGSVQDIGTADAWNLLQAAGKTSSQVRIAVLDGGFEPNEDFPASMSYSSVIPWVLDPVGHPGYGTRWHGTKIVGVALGQIDDGFGVAGSAGPIGRGQAIFTTIDMFFAQAAVSQAWLSGTRILSMSFSPRIPSVLAWTVLPFEVVTASAYSSGNAVLFGSSGNEEEDVDEVTCAWPFDWPCWEKAWHTPCENDGVLCVGGLAWDSKSRHQKSNYGHEHVDIYGPYVVFGGPDPDFPQGGTTVRMLNGTSYATPYVAGVAALLRAADPTLGSSQVWALLRDHAHSSPDADVGRYVNAHGAVHEAVEKGVTVELTSPAPGTVMQMGSLMHFKADVGFVTPAGGSTSVTVRWSSSRDGVLRQTAHTLAGGEAHFLKPDETFPGLSEGSHVITVRVSGAGILAEDQTTVEVVNSPPYGVEIEQPLDGSQTCPGWAVTFRGEGFDPNQPAGLPESAFRWSSSLDGLIGTGRLLLSSLSQVGTHAITLRVTDSEGLFVEESVAVSVLASSDPACANSPPTAVITSPPHGSSYPVTGQDAQGYYIDLDLEALIGDTEDGYLLSVEWSSDVEGDLGPSFITPIDSTSATLLLPARLHLSGCGTVHTITLRVTDSGGMVREDQIQVSLYMVC